MNDQPKSKLPKAYGSIAHLPDSRMGVGDKPLHAGQVKILWEKVRDKHDEIFVTEKLDGSCVAVVKINSELIAISRAGYLCKESSYPQHRAFYRWVEKNKPRFDELLAEGERIVGEWMVMSHGIKYNLPHEPFVAFDIMINHLRLNYEVFLRRANYFITPSLIHKGASLPLDQLKNKLITSSHGGEYPEGAVYRVERKGLVDFLGKWVVPQHVCGKYFIETGEVHNEFPDKEGILNE